MDDLSVPLPPKEHRKSEVKPPESKPDHSPLLAAIHAPPKQEPVHTLAHAAMQPAQARTGNTMENTAQVHSPTVHALHPAEHAQGTTAHTAAPTQQAAEHQMQQTVQKSFWSKDRIGSKRPELPKAKKEKKKRKKLQRKSLQEYFDKAGYALNAEKFKKRMFQIVVAIFAITSALVIIIAAIEGAKTTDVLLFFFALWTAVFAGVLLAVMAAVYFFLDYRIYKRTKEMEDYLPDFLQLASANIAAGMPIDRALWYSIRPNFGVLAMEMELVAKSTMAGEDLETSLLRMANKYDSVVLKRSVSILIEGLQAGGEMADLLNKIALNIDEMKVMKKEMAANVTTYAIFITFASIIIAPFLFALATELLSIIIKITGSMDMAGGGTFSMKAPPVSVIHNFKVFSVLMLFVTAIFSTSLVSVIKRGNIYEGIKGIPVYALIAIVIYYVASYFLHAMFAGII